MGIPSLTPAETCICRANDVVHRRAPDPTVPPVTVPDDLPPAGSQNRADESPHNNRSVPQVQTMWFIGEPMGLPPVTIPDDLPPPGRDILAELARLVVDCTQLDPDLRPTFKEVNVRLKAVANAGGVASEAG